MPVYRSGCGETKYHIPMEEDFGNIQQNYTCNL